MAFIIENMIATLALPLINRLLGQQDWAAQELRPHAGKHLRIAMGGMALQCAINDEGQLIRSPADAELAVSIQLPVQALSQLGDGIDGISRHARIEGDAQLAETIAHLLRHLRPDIGATLSPLFGDVVAQRIDDGIGSLAAALADSSQRVGTNLRDYLVNESPSLVDQHTLADFSKDVRRLRDDLARLEKRIERL